MSGVLGTGLDSYWKELKHLIPPRLQDPACEGNPDDWVILPRSDPDSKAKERQAIQICLEQCPALDACRRISTLSFVCYLRGSLVYDSGAITRRPVTISGSIATTVSA
jgi:hypothetical protein